MPLLQETLGQCAQHLLPAFSPRDIAQTLAGYANLELGANSKALDQVAIICRLD
jgi:hypothetical protein